MDHGHSRLCIWGSQKSCQGATYPVQRKVYNNAGLICKVYEQIATKNAAANCRHQQPHCCFMHLPKEPLRITVYTLYFQKREVLAYIFATDSMALGLVLFTQLSFKSKPLRQNVLA